MARRPAALLAAFVLVALAGCASTFQAHVGQHLFLDCAAGSGGNGSASQPWNSLGDVDSARLAPGVVLALRRDTTCHGSLAPRGSGTAQRPILITAYGTGGPPTIAADGHSADAVRIADESYVTIEDLAITNTGPPAGAARRGVHILATRPGTVRGITVRGLVVKAIDGNDAKGLGGSGGIQIDHPTADVRIADNRVLDVNRAGITVVGTGALPRPVEGAPWPSATPGVVIAGNAVSEVGGDGIVSTGTENAVIAGNTVCCGNLRGRPGVEFNAGIWAFDANGTVIEDNVVHGMANGAADGTGFDADYNQDGTIFAGNVGYDNAGGFILLCENGGAPRRVTIRFNLSLAEPALHPAPCAPPSTGPPGTLSGIEMYNNTLVVPAGAPTTLPPSERTLPAAGDFRFFNNLVIGTGRGARRLACGPRCAHNLFWGLPPSGSAAVRADPRVVGGSRLTTVRTGLGAPFRLRPGSPARAAGTALPDSNLRDFFGVPVSASRPPIGFSGP